MIMQNLPDAMFINYIRGLHILDGWCFSLQLRMGLLIDRECSHNCRTTTVP